MTLDRRSYPWWMTLDRRSYPWWVCLTAHLEDAPPHFGGRTSKRWTFRTRTDALAKFEQLAEMSDRQLDELARPYQVQPAKRQVVRWALSFGAVKMYENRFRDAGDEPWQDVVRLTHA